MDMHPGWRARSLAGNDRGQIYVIKEDSPPYVFLLGPNGRTLRKNKKHVQVIKRMKELQFTADASCPRYAGKKMPPPVNRNMKDVVQEVRE